MRVLIITLGSLGDLLPFLAIAQALRARGHQVSMGASSRFEPHVRSLGFDFSSLSASEHVQRPPEDSRHWDLNRTWILGWERVMAPAMRPTYEFIRVETQHHDSCVVLAHWAAFGARLAHEKLDVPLCTVYLSPEALNPCDTSGTLAPRWRNFSEDEVFGPLLNAYRRELDLRPVDRICSHWVHSPQQGLALFPDSFCARQPYWPERITTTGFVPFDEPLTATEAPQLAAFLDSGTPPVVFTPGTGMSQAGHFFRQSLAACEAIGARALLLTPYPAQVPASLPPWALHVDYVPLRSILQRVSALVYHGGIGTCAQAMRAGVPQLLAPMVVDQFDNAQRIEALGLGVSVPMSDYHQRVVTEKLGHLLNVDAVRQACSGFAARLAADDSNASDKVCKLIERLG
jgi:rhamnosyltransferase subunit B